MHPQIQQPERGDCPICGMDLIPQDSGGDDDEDPRAMSMSEAARALADIRTTEVLREHPEAKIRLVGKLDYDETREQSLTARFPARIDELFVNFTGIRVRKGEHLAEVYSPDLLAAQRELLTAHRSDPDGALARAAREKLRLWDLLPEQIDAIIESGKAKDHFVLKAPIGGVVVDKRVKEGDYLETGDSLFRIVDLSVLWANLHAYESDLPWLRYGQDVRFTVEAHPGESFQGRIAFIEPEVDRSTRTTPVRVNVPNVDGRLKPGMFVRAVVKARLAEEGKVMAPDFAGKWISPMHPEVVKDHPGQCDVCGMDLVPAEKLGYADGSEGTAPLVIPSSAVLRTGQRAVVYVEQPGTERPTYLGREITLGPRAGDRFVVAAGLAEGDRVVTNGAFKIDSALQIQARPSMMNPGEEEAGHGHEHGTMGSESVDTASAGGLDGVEIPADTAAGLLEPYLALQDALASDDLKEAKEQAKAMMAVTGHSGDLAKLVHEMMAADSLASLRLPHFETLSMGMIAAVKDRPKAFPDGLMVMHCPMVEDDRGADWLQAAEPLRNPYYGDSMLYCGYVKHKLDD
jgi:Cu(I)/Ag(I) efflux system membrane fusion protein